jgi:hypothetical protein
VHLAGVRLQVRGLAFQQQDLGVSACATTAIWSALQSARHLEETAFATPAQITARATQYALPYGRSMPSEGLTVEQMCQAVRSFNFAPDLVRPDDFRACRRILHASILSGICPIAILEEGPDADAHAVAVVGMKVRDRREAPLGGFLDDHASELSGLYVHDDRYGPYLRGEVRPSSNGHLLLRLSTRERGDGEDWLVTRLLFALHSKIRLSFNELCTISFGVTDQLYLFRRVETGAGGKIGCRRAIVRGYTYVESICVDASDGAHLAEALYKRVPLPRYVGVIRMEGEQLDRIDLLLDTTSTKRNLHALAVVKHGSDYAETRDLADLLAKYYDCEFIH